MAAAFPSAWNVYIPSTEATNNLVVDFSRNPSEFKMSEWTQYVPVKANKARYIRMTIEQAGRILNTNLADFAWPDGMDAPENKGELESFEFFNVETLRYNFGFRMGEYVAELAAWDILAHSARIAAQRAMTARTQTAVSVATTSGNYPSGHSSAVASITGVTGKWDVSTTARQDIKRSLDHAFEVIHKATLGAVKPDQVMLVIGPGTARKMSVSQEIKDYLKGSPSAEKDLRGGLSEGSKNLYYGLPDTYSGYKLVVEDTVKVTSRKGATRAASYTLADGSAFMCARPGALEGVEGSPSFSTFTTFLFKELLVESKHDRDNKVHKGRVIDDYDVEMTAPISGFLFSSATA